MFGVDPECQCAPWLERIADAFTDLRGRVERVERAAGPIQPAARKSIVEMLQRPKDPVGFGYSDDQIYSALTGLPDHQRAELASWLYNHRRRQTHNGGRAWHTRTPIPGWLSDLAHGRDTR
ncbi:MAG: hypothetical protein V4515_14680 [Chloroflexota bacterium]